MIGRRELADGADGDWRWATQRSVEEGGACEGGVWEAKERALLESVRISIDSNSIG